MHSVKSNSFIHSVVPNFAILTLFWRILEKQIVLISSSECSSVRAILQPTASASATILMLQFLHESF